jgi:hypothetical protein
MVCLPAINVDVVQEAVATVFPALMLTCIEVQAAIPVLLSVKLTVFAESGTAAPVGAFTVAVKVTEPFRGEGDPDVVTIADVRAWLTVCEIAAEVLVL